MTESGYQRAEEIAFKMTALLDGEHDRDVALAIGMIFSHFIHLNDHDENKRCAGIDAIDEGMNRGFGKFESTIQ